MNTVVDEKQRIDKSQFTIPKELVAALIFIAVAVYLATIVPTIEIAWVSGILILTIYLFAFEIDHARSVIAAGTLYGAGAGTGGQQAPVRRLLLQCRHIHYRGNDYWRRPG